MHNKTVIILLSIVSIIPLLCSSASPKFLAYWGFGDVVTDTGNNNFIPTFFRSNFKPYGRDFPNRGEPTGRFNNGLLPIDYICSGLGFKNLTPPYLNKTLANDQALVTGATFASGGSGYDPLTPILLGSLPLSTQINLFQDALERIKRLVGEEMTKSIVRNSLFVVSSGTADFSLFYDIPIRSTQYNISGYQDFILQRVKDFIQRLYLIGARKLFVSTSPPIGCIPFQITLAGNVGRQCVKRQNDDSFAYNGKFELLISNLQQELTNSTIVPYDFYNITMEVFGNPAKYGFEVQRIGCCGTGLSEVGPTCLTGLVKACPNTSEYVFWDAFNPTQAFYKILSDDGLLTINSKFS